MALYPQPMTWRALPRALAITAAIGALIGVTITAIVMLIRGTPPHPFGSLGYSALLGTIFGLSFYVTCALPPSLMRGHWPASGTGMVLLFKMVLGLGGGIAGCYLSFWLASMVPNVRITVPQLLDRIALLDGFIAAGIGVAISIRQTKRMKQELRMREQSEAAAHARAAALQAQINPHFFFNTLNTVSALIPAHPQQAQRVIGKLADMFRYTMSSGEGLVPLREEMEFVRQYLEIEQARYGDRLAVVLPVIVPDIAVPSLTLQPLVENAIRHGISKRIEGGTVRVEASPHVISVSNDCDGTPEVSFVEGHALANVRERLALAFGPQAGPHFEVADGTVTATIQLPQ